MITASEAVWLKAYVGGDERIQGAPVYRVIVETARRLGLAGASVFPAAMSYGVHRRFHDVENEYSSFEIPVIIDVIDSPERIEAALREIAPLMSSGLLMASPARVERWTTPDGAWAGRVAGETQTFKSEESAMTSDEPWRRVTVYFGSADVWEGRGLGTAIIEKCRAMGLAGATLSRGVMGFGHRSVIHRAHFLGLSDDLPEKVEVVERPHACERLVEALEGMIGSGLVVVEDVRVVSRGRADSAPAAGG